MFSMMISCSISNRETGCSTSGYFNTKYTILLVLRVTLPRIYWMFRFFYFSLAQPKTRRISCSRQSWTLDKGLLAFQSGDPSQSKERRSKRLLLESAATDQQLFPNLSNGKEQCVSSEVKFIYVPRQLISIMMHFLPSEGRASHYLILASIQCAQSVPLMTLWKRCTPSGRHSQSSTNSGISRPCKATSSNHYPPRLLRLTDDNDQLLTFLVWVAGLEEGCLWMFYFSLKPSVQSFAECQRYLSQSLRRKDCVELSVSIYIILIIQVLSRDGVGRISITMQRGRGLFVECRDSQTNLIKLLGLNLYQMSKPMLILAFLFFTLTNSQVCLVSQCISCPVDPTICQTCAIFTYLTNNTCQPCPHYCTRCSSTVCFECFPGNYLDSDTNRCEFCPISNCLRCNSTDCLECNENYLLINDTGYSLCLDCKVNKCKTCTASLTCLTCLKGYYLSGSQCLYCLDKCQDCSAFNQCTTCFEGFYLLDINATQMCKSCGDRNCLTCSATKCASCIDGYYLAGFQCQQCLQGYCKECTKNTCVQCYPGYYLEQNGTSLLCSPCAKLNCSLCTSNGFCQECLAGYYKASDDSCQICATKNCQTCNGQTCLNCILGYYLNANTCKPCSVPSCATCTSDGACFQCMEKHYLIDNQCEQCPISNCNICSNSIKECYICDEGYFAKNNKCESCASQNCKACSSATGECYTCVASYYLASSKTCQLCQVQFCQICSSSQVCQTCQTNYQNTNDGQQCNLVRIIQQNTSFPWYFWVLMGIAAFIVLLYAYRQLLKLKLGGRSLPSQGEGYYVDLPDQNLGR